MDFAASSAFYALTPIWVGATSLDVEAFACPRLISTLSIALSALTLSVAIARAIVTCRRFRRNFQQSGEGNLSYRGVRYWGPNAKPSQVSSAFAERTGGDETVQTPSF